MICLSIVAKTRGVGFIITLDAEIIDFGIKRFTSQNNSQKILSEILNWIHVGDIKKLFINQGQGLKTIPDHFLDTLETFAKLSDLDIITITNDDLVKTFPKLTRFEIAEMLGRDINTLTHLLPSKKKLWESESASMLIFDAAAQMRAQSIL